MQVAERSRLAVERTVVRSAAGEPIPLTTSMGIATRRLAKMEEMPS